MLRGEAGEVQVIKNIPEEDKFFKFPFFESLLEHVCPGDFAAQMDVGDDDSMGFLHSGFIVCNRRFACKDVTFFFVSRIKDMSRMVQSAVYGLFSLVLMMFLGGVFLVRNLLMQ